MINVAITTSPGGTIAIAVKPQRLEEAVVEIAVVEAEDNAGTIVAEIAVVEAEDNAGTTVAEIAVVVAEDNAGTTVAEIAEVETVEETTEGAMTVVHHAENIAAAMIADPHDVIPENQVDGGPKARAAPAGAEISRKAFI